MKIIRQVEIHNHKGSEALKKQSFCLQKMVLFDDKVITAGKKTKEKNHF